jgi:hypothetical protein
MAAMADNEMLATTTTITKGRRARVESGVGYVKKNFLHGLELTDFSTIHAAAVRAEPLPS